MSDFKDFSKKATKDNEAKQQVQANEHTEVTPPNTPQPDPVSTPASDQNDKGMQPDHNTSTPS